MKALNRVALLLCACASLSSQRIAGATPSTQAAPPAHRYRVGEVIAYSGILKVGKGILVCNQAAEPSSVQLDRAAGPGPGLPLSGEHVTVEGVLRSRWTGSADPMAQQPRQLNHYMDRYAVIAKRGRRPGTPRVGETIIYAGILRQGKAGLYLDNRAAQPPGLQLGVRGGPAPDRSLVGSHMVVKGVLQSRRIGSDRPGAQTPRQVSYYVDPCTVLEQTLSAEGSQADGATVYSGILKRDEEGHYLFDPAARPCGVYLGLAGGLRPDPALEGRPIKVKGELRSRWVGSSGPTSPQPWQLQYYMDRYDVVEGAPEAPGMP